MNGGEGIARQTFGQHIRELRRRLSLCLIVLLIGSSVGYALHEQLLNAIRQPLKHQLYYTSPVGGFNALLLISLMTGIVLAIPVFVYQLIRFISPALPMRYSWGFARTIRLIFFSAFLAGSGIAFAYFVSLPAALRFLTNVGGDNLQAFITINEYLRFALSYLAGFAILFQLPLILLFINRIKPLKPSKLMKYQRYVIVGSFIIAAVLTPTPDPFNQALMASPVIVLYQFSVIWIWIRNRKKFPKTAQRTEPRVKLAPVPAALPLTPPRPALAITPMRRSRVLAFDGVRANYSRPPKAINRTPAVSHRSGPYTYTHERPTIARSRFRYQDLATS